MATEARERPTMRRLVVWVDGAVGAVKAKVVRVVGAAMVARVASMAQTDPMALTALMVRMARTVRVDMAANRKVVDLKAPRATVLLHPLHLPLLLAPLPPPPVKKSPVTRMAIPSPAMAWTAELVKVPLVLLALVKAHPELEKVPPVQAKAPPAPHPL